MTAYEVAMDAIRGFLTTKSSVRLGITFIELVEPTFSLEIRLFY